MTSGRTAGPERLHRLDGLRGLAAFGVAFLYHGKNLIAPDTLALVPQPIAWFRDWGWMLVDLFFLISGYIFAHVYLSSGGLRREGLGEFFIARVARLYPLHVLTLCICAVLLAAEPESTPLAFVANLAMLQAFYPFGAQAFNGPSWSISVECLCYLIFAMSAVSGEKRLHMVSWLAVGAALLHFVAQGQPGGPWNGDDIPRGLIGFFLGQLMWQARGMLARIPGWALAIGLVLGIGIDTGHYSSLLPICLLAWPAALLLTQRVALMEIAVMRWLGDRSYAIYLIHFPVLKAMFAVTGHIGGGLGNAGLGIVCLATITLLLSDLSFRFVETPARKAIRQGWDRKTRARTVPDPAA